MRIYYCISCGRDVGFVEVLREVVRLRFVEFKTVILLCST